MALLKSYPPLGFHFGVDILGVTPLNLNLGFREVSGITQSIGNGKTWKEGGENRFTHRLPEPPTYGDLVLKRGIKSSTFGSALKFVGLTEEAGVYDWFLKGLEGDMTGFEPRSILVRLNNEFHIPIHAWHFKNAWPKQWEVSGFNATNSEIVIETVTLSYQYMEKIPLLEAAGLVAGSF
jgi:phage tail-like protein